MDQWASVRQRLRFLASAFEGNAGFAPNISHGWGDDGRWQAMLSGTCELVRYSRESDAKYAGRAALAVYENHLRSACERFVSYLGRKPPQRDDVQSPLHQALLLNADLAGSPLDDWMTALALNTRARGCMLVLVRMPEGDAGPSMLSQLERRAVPYLQAIAPETVAAYELDRFGLLHTVAWQEMEVFDGKPEALTHEWRADALRVYRRDKLLRTEPHPFGACPVLAITENGRPFPQVGKFAQIAALSRRVFNARSELDELLRSQTFSVLAYQVTDEEAPGFDARALGATIGTHSMVLHRGVAPAFISPDSGPAQVYMAVLDQLQASISRIGMEAVADSGKFNAESGVSRRLRFEALNAELATFARQLRRLEKSIWELFARALGTTDRSSVSYPTDYNLTDVTAELDILSMMQATGMPEAVLDAKRAAVVAAEFDAATEELKTELQLAIAEGAHQRSLDPNTT